MFSWREIRAVLAVVAVVGFFGALLAFVIAVFIHTLRALGVL